MKMYIGMVLVLMAFGIDQDLLLYPGFIANDHGYEFDFGTSFSNE